MLRAIFRDSLIYTLPMVLSRGLGFLLLPIYGRILSKSEFGVLDLVLAVGPLVNVVVCLEVQQGLARLRVDADEETQRRMTGSAWIFSATACAVFVVAAMPLAGAVSIEALGDASFSSAIRLGIVSLAAASLFNLVMNQFRWELRSRSYASVSALYALATVALTVLLTLVGNQGLSGVLLAQCISATAGVLVCLAILRKSWVPALDLHHLRLMLAFSFPLIPASLSVFVTLYFNRIALKLFGDLSDVADYGMAARLAGLVGLLIVGMQGAVTPLIYRHFRDAETPKQLAQLFSGVVGLCFVLCIALNAFAADLVVAVAGEQYSGSASLVALIGPALLMGQLYVFAPGMALAFRTRAQLAVATAAAVVDVFANLALIPALGAMGAALSAVISSAAFLGLWVLASQRHYPVAFERRRLLLGSCVFAAGSLGAALVRTRLEPLDLMGLVVKAFVVLVCTALIYRTRLFQGAVGALGQRSRGEVSDPGSPAIDRS